jgi:hypothetical protein
VALGISALPKLHLVKVDHGNIVLRALQLHPSPLNTRNMDRPDQVLSFLARVRVLQRMPRNGLQLGLRKLDNDISNYWGSIDTLAKSLDYQSLYLGRKSCHPQLSTGKL